MNAPIRILYVDDYPLDRELVLDALEKEHSGFEVTLATSRADFETAIANNVFDLVLTDFNILGFEGLQVLDAAHARDADMPVIIVTGTGSEEVAVEAMKRGASDYVIKTPHHIGRLPFTIQTALEKKRVEKERRLAETRIQSQLQHIAALHRIDVAISSNFNLNMVLDVVLEQTIDQLGVDAASVLLVNKDTQTLDYAAGRGFRSKTIENTRLRLGEGWVGRAALERKIVSLHRFRDLENEDARATALTGEGFVCYHAAPLIAKGQIKGVLEVFTRSYRETNNEWLDFFSTLASQAAVAVDNAHLFENLQRAVMELAMAYDATIEGWSRALDLRDRETEGHTQRVAELTERLARAMGVNEAEIVHIRRGALLHDIGKMGVPDAILLKPDKLTEEEWAIMRQHPVYAYELLSPIAYLHPALDIPYCHHEKWDGTGYPRQLKGEQIPLAARLFAVVDVWDALLSDRPYRPGWPREQALAYIRSQAGAYFDPQVVKAFLRMIETR
ncbi:MAG: HD domain-containing phosphohydrolase [Anaerolineales bacterium]|nr:HD domain-containing phosphohydrolase [Anaerolineales bacterium]